jgi:hypothetical protein
MYCLNSDSDLAAFMRYEPLVVLTRCHDKEDFVHYWSQAWDGLDHCTIAPYILAHACWRIYGRLRQHGTNTEIETRLGLTASSALEKLIAIEPLHSDMLSTACVTAAVIVDVGQESQIGPALNRFFSRCAKIGGESLDHLSTYALYVLSTKLANHGCLDHLITLGRVVLPLLEHVDDMKMRCELALVLSIGCQAVVAENKDPTDTQRVLDAALRIVSGLGACTMGIGSHPAQFNVALADVHFAFKAGLANDEVAKKIDSYVNHLLSRGLPADKRHMCVCGFLGEVARLAFLCFRDDLGRKYLTCLEEMFGRDVSLAKLVATMKQRVVQAATIRPAMVTRVESLEVMGNPDALKGWDERYGVATLARVLGEEASSFMAMVRDLVKSPEFFRWGPNANAEIQAAEKLVSDVFQIDIHVPESDRPRDSKGGLNTREQTKLSKNPLYPDSHAGPEEYSETAPADWQVDMTIQFVRGLLLCAEQGSEGSGRGMIPGWIRRVQEIASDATLTDLQKTVELIVKMGADVITGLAENNATQAAVVVGMCLAWRAHMLGRTYWLYLLCRTVKAVIAQPVTAGKIERFKHEVATVLYLLGPSAAAPQAEKTDTQKTRTTQKEMLTTARLVETQLWLELDCEERDAEKTVRDGYVEAVGKVYRRMAMHPTEVHPLRCVLQARNEMARVPISSSLFDSFFPSITETKADMQSRAMLYNALALETHVESVIKFLDRLSESIECPCGAADTASVASYWESQMAVVRFFEVLLSQARFYGAMAPEENVTDSAAHRMAAGLARLCSVIAEHSSRVSRA